MTESSSHFAIVTRDQLWSLDRRQLVESRLVHGVADRQGETIEARDDCVRPLLERCNEESERVRVALGELREGRARAVTFAQSTDRGVSVSSTITVRLIDLSIATTLPHVSTDYEMLIELASVRPEATADYRAWPVVWRNGSAAVLLHEAAGHASERAHGAVGWPSWLTAADESEDGSADLLAGETPRAIRRQSFSDVPLRRMTNVVVGNRGGDLELPPRRIDVLLLAGGSYEPLTETISLSIAAADLVDGGRSQRLHRFTMTESRAAVARALRGASGPVRRYPGVICSKEGQELFVGSYAPDVVTEL